jgi:hypothetical protein
MKGQMINAIMIRKTKPMSIHRLPERSDSEKRYQYGMQESAKALCQAVLDSGHLHGPMTEAEQIEAISWAYDVKVMTA